MTYDTYNLQVENYSYIKFFSKDDMRRIDEGEITEDDIPFVKIQTPPLNSTNMSRYVSEYMTVPVFSFNASRASAYEKADYERVKKYFDFDTATENKADLIEAFEIGYMLCVCCGYNIQMIKVYIGEDGSQTEAMVFNFIDNEVILPKVLTVSKLINQQSIPVFLHTQRLTAHQENFCGVKGILIDKSILSKHMVLSAGLNNILDRVGAFAITNDQQTYFLGTPSISNVDNLSNRRGQFPYSGTSIVGDSNIIVSEEEQNG